MSAASLGSLGSLSPGAAVVESLLPLLRGPHTTRRPSLLTQQLQPEPQPLGEHPAVLQARSECASLLNGNDVRVLEDADVQEPVVQVLGRDAELLLPARSAMRFLVLFLKSLARFCAIRVELVDDRRQFRELAATNARSLAKVDLHASTCQLPLLLGGDQPGWRYVCLDLQELTREAFGSSHVATTSVRITGDCRVMRVFFQDEQYADNQLPPHLTFLG